MQGHGNYQQKSDYSYLPNLNLFFSFQALRLLEKMQWFAEGPKM